MTQLRNPTLAQFYIGASTPCNETAESSLYFAYAMAGKFIPGSRFPPFGFGNKKRVCCPNQIKKPPPFAIGVAPTPKPTTWPSWTKPTVKPQKQQQPILGGPNGPRPPRPPPASVQQPTPKPNPMANVTTTMSTTAVPIQSNCGNPRIVGGTVARPGSYPWVVSIVHGSRHVCGGSLIDSLHVLTAAHCFIPFSSRDLPQLRILLGDHDLSTTTEAVHVAKRVRSVIKHRGFSQQLLKNDIAIIKLDSPVHFSTTISPICLTSGENMLPSKTELLLAGWGGVRYPSPTEKVLRHVTLPLWTNEACASKYGHLAPGGITSTQICAGATNRDACQGDSGGPLMYKNSYGKYEQIGIVSWGIGCGSYPGVYTRISSFLSWIEKNRLLK